MSCLFLYLLFIPILFLGSNVKFGPTNYVHISLNKIKPSFSASLTLLLISNGRTKSMHLSMSQTRKKERLSFEVNQSLYGPIQTENICQNILHVTKTTYLSHNLLQFHMYISRIQIFAYMINKNNQIIHYKVSRITATNSVHVCLAKTKTAISSQVDRHAFYKNNNRSY